MRHSSQPLLDANNPSKLKAEPNTFILHTVNPVKLTKNDLSEINQTKAKLLKVKDNFCQPLSNKKKVPPEYNLSPIQYLRINKLIFQTFFAYKVFISDINKIQANLCKSCIKVIDNCQNLIDFNEKRSHNVKCDFKKLQDFLNEKQQKCNIPKLVEKAEKLTKNMNFYLPKINSLLSNEQFLYNKLKLQLPKIKEKEDYVEMNEFDDLLSTYIQSRKNDDRLQEIISSIKYGKEQYLGYLFEKLSKLLKITTDDESIILKSSCIRYFYDLSYSREPEVLKSNANCQIFFKNCNFITSFSPKSLGLNSHLFTADQMDLPFIGLVRDSDILLNMSADLNSLQFMTSPIDMMIVISKVILRLEDFVKKNILNKKFGQFASMVESDFNKKKNREMMSFDDCFSLFFSILSIDPPLNAIEISVYFQNSPELTYSMPLKMAKATYISAVDHILGFSDEQIVKDPHEEILEDPLGIL